MLTVKLFMIPPGNAPNIIANFGKENKFWSGNDRMLRTPVHDFPVGLKRSRLHRL